MEDEEDYDHSPSNKTSHGESQESIFYEQKERLSNKNEGGWWFEHSRPLQRCKWNEKPSIRPGCIQSWPPFVNVYFLGIHVGKMSASRQQFPVFSEVDSDSDTYARGNIHLTYPRTMCLKNRE